MNSFRSASVFSVPLCLNFSAFVLFCKIDKTPAISKIPNPNTPKPRAILTVPLCSALFRQNFFFRSYVVGPLGGSVLIHYLLRGKKSQINNQPVIDAPPLLGERVGVRGSFVSNARFPLQCAAAVPFNFVQVCSGLFRFKYFSGKSQPAQMETPSQSGPAVHAPYTLFHAIPRIKKSSRNCFPPLRALCASVVNWSGDLPRQIAT